MVVADYAVVSKISDGPMAQTFEAVRRGTGRTVALHVLAPMWRETHGLPEAWAAWGAALQRLQHPGLAECHGAGMTSDGLFYSVFEWLDGVNLRRRLESGALDQHDAFRVMVGILDALDVVHAHGLVHGDLRPENVFCTTDGEVKLLGAGLSECLRSRQSASDGRLLAAAAYVSPEQIAGGPATIQTDLYAFGMLAHECLLGKHPLVGDSQWPTVPEMLLRQSERTPATLEGLPTRVREVFEKAVAKSPKRRPKSARQILAVLRSVASEKGEGAAGSVARADGLLPGHGGLALVGPRQQARRAVLALPGAIGRWRVSGDEWNGRASPLSRARVPLQRVPARVPPRIVAGARRASRPSLATWLQWPYGHMLIGGVVGVVAGVLVYVWQSRPLTPPEVPSRVGHTTSSQPGGAR